jgi:hypothetical protein
MYGTSLRLNLHVHAGWRTVIRTAAGKLTGEARRDPAKRDLRKQFYHEMLTHHGDAQQIVHRFRL